MKLSSIAIAFSLLALPATALAQEYYPPSSPTYTEPLPPQGAYGAGVDVQVDGFFDAFDASIGGFDQAAPDQDYVWVDAQILADGRRVDGFYRLRTRPGMRWSNGYYSGNRWIAPGWQPTRLRRTDTWTPGHRGADGYWVAGQIRPKNRRGFQWVAGSYRGNLWVNGYWSPLQNQNNSHWVAGYQDANQNWVPGFWRANARAGFRWQEGSWRYGTWTPGTWVPTQRRNNSVWVSGHYNGRNWIDGHWRVNQRSGFQWVAPSRSPNGAWIDGHWSASVRVAPRRHNVVRVQDIVRARQSQQRVWDPSPQGRVQRRSNRHVETRQQTTTTTTNRRVNTRVNHRRVLRPSDRRRRRVDVRDHR